MLLETNLIKLRALEPADLELLYQWENDTSIWKVSNTLAPFSKYILQQYIENSHKDLFENKQLRLIIELRKHPVSIPIGAIDLFDIDFLNARAGIGILIANEKNRNHGYSSETIKLIHKYALSHLGLNQLYCHIDEDNQPSLALFEKLGYQITGKQKQWKKSENGWKDVFFLQHLF